MIGADVFAVDPWSIPERELHLDLLGQTESIFALSNGHIGLRGNLEEGEPSFTPGTFLNSFYEVRPLPYAESAYGNPEAGQTMINVTDGKVLRLLVDDEPWYDMSGCLSYAPACCAGKRSGYPRQASVSGCVRSGWCPLSSARWPPLCMRWSRWVPRRGSVSSRSLWPMSQSRSGRATPGWRRRCTARW